MPAQAPGAGGVWRPAGRAALRPSDADRDRVLAELRDRYAEGRLSHETFLHRVDAVLRSKRQADLDSQLADLPRRQDSAAEFRAGGVPLVRAITGQLRAAAVRLGAITTARRADSRPPGALVLPAPEQARFTIGREPGSDLMLADMTVSRRHAALHRRPGGWLLSDLGSTNGTRLNGWRVSTPVLVCPGDQVRFGDLALIVAARPGIPADGGAGLADGPAA